MEQRPTIRAAHPEDLPAAASLLASCLGFAPADAVPAWLMRTTDECGGLTLVAVKDGAVIGVSYAYPAWLAGTAVLFSCGLAVAPAHRGRHLAIELKHEQRRRALAAGYTSIRWTADPMNARALRVYLSGLGALMTAYRSGFYDGLRADPGHPQDDVEVVWPLADRPELDGGVRRVELPWSGATLDDRRRVRSQLVELLETGFVGCDIELDHSAHRCWVALRRVSP